MAAAKNNEYAKGKGAVQTGQRPRKGTKTTGGIYVPEKYSHLAQELDAWIRSYPSLIELLVSQYQEKHRG